MHKGLGIRGWENQHMWNDSTQTCGREQIILTTALFHRTRPSENKQQNRVQFSYLNCWPFLSWKRRFSQNVSHISWLHPKYHPRLMSFASSSYPNAPKHIFSRTWTLEPCAWWWLTQKLSDCVTLDITLADIEESCPSWCKVTWQIQFRQENGCQPKPFLPLWTF